MPAPDPPFELTKLAERLRERALPLGEGEELRGWAYSILCQALLEAGVELEQGFDPDEPHLPVGVLMTYNAPAWALPWAAQIVGVRLPAGFSEQEYRDLIKGSAHWGAGTAATMRAAAELYLTGFKTIYFNERWEGDAYVLAVATLDTETPDPELVRRALEATKPAGIRLEYGTVALISYGIVEAAYDSYEDLEAAFATYDDLANNQPT